MPYDPKTTADILGISLSTLRRFALEFPDVLSPDAARTVKKRHYNDDDIRALKIIKDGSSRHRDHDDIRRDITLTSQAQDPQPSTLAMLPDVIARFDQLAGAMADLRDQVAQANQRHDEMLARLQALEEFNALPWWQKFGKRPPK